VASFKEQNRELQELAREVVVLRRYNQTIRDSGELWLVFAEGAVVLVTLERFLRAMLGDEAGPEDTLPNLLEMAMGDRLYLFDPPGGDAKHLVDLVTGVRNGLLHGDFEQLARRAGFATNAEYFASRFRNDLNVMFNILNTIMRQIDPSTGQRYEWLARQMAHTGFVDMLERRRAKLERITIAQSRARAKPPTR
jgi:hypothetical protein